MSIDNDALLKSFEIQESTSDLLNCKKKGKVETHAQKVLKFLNKNNQPFVIKSRLNKTKLDHLKFK